MGGAATGPPVAELSATGARVKSSTLFWLFIGYAVLTAKASPKKPSGPVTYPPAPDLPVQIPIPPNPLKNNPPK